MGRIERARILLETALAKQRGVPLEEITPIAVDYGKSKGVSAYTGHPNFRQMNQALRADDANEWNNIADSWKNQHSWDSEQKDLNFGDNVLRAAISVEDELLENPSPYSPEIHNAPRFDGHKTRGDHYLDPSVKWSLTGKPLYKLSRSPRLKDRGDLEELLLGVSDYNNPSTITPQLSYGDNTLFRGMHFPSGERDKFISWLEADGVNKGFTSVSRDFDHANSFAVRRKEDSLLFRIDPSIKNEQLNSVAHPRWGFNVPEDEFIYLPGTKFDVKDIYTGKDVQSVLGPGRRSNADMMVDIVPREVDLSVPQQYFDNNKEALELIRKRKMLEQRLAKIQHDLLPTIKQMYNRFPAEDWNIVDDQIINNVQDIKNIPNFDDIPF